MYHFKSAMTTHENFFINMILIFGVIFWGAYNPDLTIFLLIPSIIIVVSVGYSTIATTNFVNFDKFQPPILTKDEYKIIYDDIGSSEEEFKQLKESYVSNEPVKKQPFPKNILVTLVDPFKHLIAPIIYLSKNKVDSLYLHKFNIAVLFLTVLNIVFLGIQDPIYIIFVLGTYFSINYAVGFGREVYDLNERVINLKISMLYTDIKVREILEKIKLKNQLSKPRYTVISYFDGREVLESMEGKQFFETKAEAVNNLIHQSTFYLSNGEELINTEEVDVDIITNNFENIKCITLQEGSISFEEITPTEIINIFSGSNRSNE